MANQERGPIRETLYLLGAVVILLGSAALLGAGLHNLKRL